MIKNLLDLSALKSVVEKETKNWENGVVREGDEKSFPMLTKYWASVGVTYTKDNKLPWSAAYVSWCITQVESSFPKSAAHYKYVEEALNVRNSSLPGWRLYSLSREREAILAQVGDVCVKPRSGGDSNSHGDFVWKIVGSTAYLSGGNLSDTQTSSITIALNSDGSYPKNPKEYLVVLKKK
jgi:hypothetical protein